MDRSLHEVLRYGSNHYLRYGEGGTPLFFEYVQADIAIAIYVWMENPGPEGNLKMIFHW